jgi:hypothetical protein
MGDSVSVFIGYLYIGHAADRVFKRFQLLQMARVRIPSGAHWNDDFKFWLRFRRADEPLFIVGFFGYLWYRGFSN